MGVVAISTALLKRLDTEALADRKKGLHRPTVAVVIRHIKSGRFLVVMGKKDYQSGMENPGIVKGGIDSGEHIIDAAYREVAEEIRVSRVDITMSAYYGTYSVYSLKKKENFDRKRYFVFYAKYDGSRTLDVDHNEIVNYTWIKLGDIVRTLRSLKKMRLGKYKALIKIFTILRKTKKKHLRKIEQETKLLNASVY